MAGYTRNDTTNQIADGNVINAAPLDGEFNAIESAFNVSSGHTHDGSTTGDGAPISKLGPSQETTQSGSTLATTTDITVATNKFIQFRDSGLKILSSADGKLDIDADTELEMVAPTVDIDASTAVTIDTATLTITGAANVTGDLDVDNININGNTIISTDTNGNIALTPNGTGEVDISKVDIDSGAIDAVTLGTNSPVTEAQIDNININGNAITSTDSNGNIALTPNGSGEVDISKVDIAAGEIDGVTIGTNSAVTDLRVDNIKVDGNAITSTDTDGDITITPNGNGKIVLDGLNFPIADGTAGHFLKTDGSGQLSFAEVSTDLSGDSSPQLGGMLDVNGNAIGDGTLEIIKFTETGSAVNEITIANAATGGHPLIQASGDDTNINLKLDGKGSGVVNVVDGLTVGGNTIVTGDLTVNGTTTTVATTNTVVSDSLIELANGTSGSPSNDAGIVIERGSSANAFIGFDESEDKFTMGTGTFTGASTGNLSITKGTLVADIESSKLIATNTTTNTGTAAAIQIGASTDWTVLVTAADELVFRHNGDAKMLLTTAGHLKVVDDITAFADLSSYNGS
jgi:cytoskeletal protein CcmA (bactofilin family)